MTYCYTCFTHEEVFDSNKDIYIVNCGYNDVTEYMHHTRTRSDFYLLIMTRGYGIHIHQNKKYTLKVGDMFLYFPNEKQEYYYNPKDNSVFYWVHFSGKKAMQLIKELQLSSGPIYPETSEEILKLYNRIFTEYKTRNLFYENMATNFLRNLLVTVARLKNSYSHKEEFSDAIQKITLTPTISNEECAKICHCSTVHFIRLFKKTYGITPHKYKQKVIIEQAKELLKNTNKTVNDISFMLGFEENPLYLNKLFKSITGMTPIEYRKQECKKI